MSRKRDHKAIYRRRQELARQRGYRSYGDQRRRRASADPTAGDPKGVIHLSGRTRWATRSAGAPKGWKLQLEDVPAGRRVAAAYMFSRWAGGAVNIWRQAGGRVTLYVPEADERGCRIGGDRWLSAVSYSKRHA